MAAAAGAMLVLAATPLAARGQQVADSAFAPPIAAPAYAPGRGPVVLLDEAHANFHTLGGRYLTFGRLLSRDGFVVRPNRQPFSRAVLEAARVLVIANALNAEKRSDWTLPARPAFTPEEIAAVRDWVRDGGSLLFIADHMPFPGAASDLALALGIAFTDGFIADSALDTGVMRFRRGDGSLADHPITNGRNAGERVDSLTSFTGQGFRLLRGGAPLMTIGPNTLNLLPVEAWVFSDSTPRFPAEGLLQGAVLRVGRGRVAVFGEAAMFSAQRAGPDRRPMGMNDPVAAQNPQFLLNVMHWLVGLLDS